MQCACVSVCVQDVCAQAGHVCAQVLMHTHVLVSVSGCRCLCTALQLLLCVGVRLLAAVCVQAARG